MAAPSPPPALQPARRSLVGACARGIIDFLYPPICTLCYARLDSTEHAVCFRCLAEIAFHPDWRCARCGAFGVEAEPERGRPCRHCPPPEAHYAGVLGAVGYRDTAARMVQLFKYNRRLEIGEVMARVMAERLAEPLATLGGRLDVITPVPLHVLRRLGRGFNQSLTLAQGLAAATGLPCEHLLRRRRYTRRPALMAKEKRGSNVKDAFGLKTNQPLAGKGILIVDDVVTSGSTVNECARMLKEAGAREVWVACFARTGLGPRGLAEL